jgi:hypothetical protein
MKLNILYRTNAALRMQSLSGSPSGSTRSMPSMPVRTGIGVCLVSLLLCFLTPAAKGQEYRNPSDGILSMRYEDGLLSMETRNAPLNRVLEETSRLAELAITANGPLEGNISVYIENLPPDTAMKKILRGKDLSLLYTQQSGTPSKKQFALKEVRIYLPEEGSGSEHNYSYTKKTTSENKARTRPRFRPRIPSQRRTVTPSDPRDAPPRSYEPSRDQAEKFLAGLMEGDFGALNEMAERLKEENPEAQDQIDAFLDSLEEARENADAGNPINSIQDLGNLGTIMQKMMHPRD